MAPGGRRTGLVGLRRGLENRSWGAARAAWLPDAGLALLPWADVIAAKDPVQAIIDFADATYSAAVDLSGWSADLVGSRQDGWQASRTPPARGAEAAP